MKLNAEHRRALALLAGTPRGCTESLMMAHGFKVEMTAFDVRIRQNRTYGRSKRCSRWTHCGLRLCIAAVMYSRGQEDEDHR